MVRIYVGIIGDGPADRALLAHVVRCAWAEAETIELKGLSLRDSIDRFWRCGPQAPAFPEQRSKELESAVLGVLRAAIDEFGRQMPRPSSEYDMIVIHSDAERHLTSSDAYFDDWAWSVPAILWRSIEKVYQIKCAYGLPQEQLPTIAPFVPFPSTEIVLAIASGIDARGKRASDLKTLIYGTDLKSGIRIENFMSVISRNSFTGLYRHVPEMRMFLRALTTSCNVSRTLRPQGMVAEMTRLLTDE